MASIERRVQSGTVRYRAHYTDPAGKQRSKSFARKQDARDYLTSIESSKLAGQYVDPTRGRITLGDVADDWLATKVSIRPTTRARYESAVETHIRPKWGTTPLTRITHEDMQQWVADIVAAGAQPGQVKKIVSVTSGMLAKAVRDRRLADNPAHGLDLPRVRPERRQYLELQQVEVMADAAKEAAGEYASVAIHVLAYSGPRWSEMAGLRVRAVDVKRRRLEIVETMTEINGGKLAWGPPKDYERRSIPVPPSVMDEIKELIKGKRPDDLVFTGPRGAPLRNRNARRSWFDAAAALAGAKGLTPHELRHTAASLAVSSGANVLAVSRMLGHADPSITLKTYADLFDSDLDDVATRLDASRIAYLVPTDSAAKVSDPSTP